MADLRKVKAKIKEIAEGTRKNVSIEEIEWVVNHLGQNVEAMIEVGLYE